MTSVLFVCLGNICRSPAGAGILAHLGMDPGLVVESAGIGDWHVGERADARMQAAALQRGIVLSDRARVIRPEDFDRFDYILAVDHTILYELYQLAPTPQQKAKIHLATAFSPTYHNQDVPDPYYGNDAGFNVVLDMLEDACEGFLARVKAKQ
ncbi:MAG: low molecular weight protein-tyrosine-phosphatase [Chlamydiales bacterium]|nr:low molecular weight protein-tyrosine-phosphatase [Chlamydiales bacterium]